MLNNCNLNDLFAPGARLLFAGVGGVSMSALCLYCKEKGMDVRGYDACENDLTRKVVSRGVPVATQFDPGLYENLDAVVYTAAIHETDPVLAYPKEIGIPLISRADALGHLSLDKKRRIGVAGTHGKSTVTGMLTKIFLAADRDPMVLAGATLNELGGTTLRVGAGEDLIFEACEYQDAFLHFLPTISVILDVERDHVDYFADDPALVRSFAAYANLPGKEGVCILNYDTPLSQSVSESVETPLISVKTSGDADYTAKQIENKRGFYRFTACYRGLPLFRVTLGVPGAFQVPNALCAIAASRACGIPDEKIVEGLQTFRGVDRRFQFRGKLNGVDVYDDYAHHPSEIAATLSAARDSGYRKIVCVFQSHTYSRTQAFSDEFTRVFSPCKEVIFADIYPAREEPIEGVSAENLAKATANGRYVGDFDAIADYLAGFRGADLFLIMGAGSIISLTDRLLERGDR